MKSVIRDTEIPQITLKEFYKKVENEALDHHLKLLIEEKESKNQVFEILMVLGKGRAGFAFLTLKDRKLAVLRMSYEKEKLTGKFDSIIEKEGEAYRKLFLNILYPAVPVQYLYSGVLRKKKTISFDKTVYASLWEKADTTLISKLNERFEKKFQWFRQFLAGLHFIHSRNRVHCDIKLENLFLVDNQLKIGDFEFYSRIEDFRQSDIFICGTPGHIAPEMFYDRENITSKIDIFSAGVAFARLFTGEEYQTIELNPGENKQLTELLKKCEKINHLDQGHLTEIKESLSYSLFYRRLLKDKVEKADPGGFEKFIYEEILLEMLALDPGHRLDVKEIMDKLEKKAPPRKEIAKDIEETEITAPKTPKGLWFLLGFLVALTVGAFLYFFVFNMGSPFKPSPSGDMNANKTKVIKPPIKRNQTALKQKDTGKKITKKPTIKKSTPVVTVEPPKTTKPEIPPEEKEKIKEQAKYETYLDIIQDLVKDGEYKKALDILARAKDIKEDDELLELERTIKEFMEKKEQDDYYKGFYKDAQWSYEQGNYEEALMNIEIARKIKDTPQLISLELEINRKLKERQEEYERGLILVEESIVNGDFSNAKELINALRKIKTDDRLLKLEKEVNQKLTEVARQRQEEESEYIECLQKVQAYMDDGDYEKAEEEIKKARKMKNSRLLRQLEEKLKDLQEQTQRNYEKYSKWARIYFDHGQLEKAKYYLDLAKNIYRSHELVVLGMEIQEKIMEQEREEAAKKADDEAYFNAIRKGKVRDLDEYIRKYPYGRHAAEAKEKLNRMLESLIPWVEEPRVIKKVEPVRSGRARRERISGIVKLEVIIDIHGNVTKADVIDGHKLLRYEAKKAVKQWKYKPVVIGGEPRSVWFTVKVVFEPTGGVSQ
jgi:TonB family protein